MWIEAKDVYRAEFDEIQSRYLGINFPTMRLPLEAAARSMISSIDLEQDFCHIGSITSSDTEKSSLVRKIAGTALVTLIGSAKEKYAHLRSYGARQPEAFLMALEPLISIKNSIESGQVAKSLYYEFILEYLISEMHDDFERKLGEQTEIASALADQVAKMYKPD